jgi:hypothetical protein
MFALRKLTLARSRNGCRTGSGDGVPLVFFSYSIKGWSGLELSLTCRQGDFAEDLSEKECGRKRQGQVDKQMPPFAGCIQNAGWNDSRTKPPSRSDGEAGQ